MKEAPQTEAFFESFRVYPPQESDLEAAVPLPKVEEEHDLNMPKLRKPMAPMQQYRIVGIGTDLKPKDVKAAAQGMLTYAAEQLNKCGTFQIADMLKFKVKVKPATATKPASQTVKTIPTKKLKDLVKSNKTY